MILVDSNVILDVVTSDEAWYDWSVAALEGAADQLVINDVIYAELSVRYRQVEELDAMIDVMELRIDANPKAALFLAGKTFQQYRRLGGTRTGVLPDFFIGAHAAVTGARLITRDVQHYHTYFPTVHLIRPA